MELSSFIRVGLFKSPVRVVAAVLLRSRETQAKRASQKTEEVQNLRRIHQQQQRDLANLRAELDQKKLQLAHLQAKSEQLRQQPPLLPYDPTLPNHEFGPKLISVCVNLARRIGLRPTVACLEIVFQWMGVTQQLPDWTPVRN